MCAMIESALDEEVAQRVVFLLDCKSSGILNLSIFLVCNPNKSESRQLDLKENTCNELFDSCRENKEFPGLGRVHARREGERLLCVAAR